MFFVCVVLFNDMFDLYIVLSLGILGLFVGSFLNVVINRFNTGVSIATGRSRCFSCGKDLSPLELFPIFSYVFQRGKCAKCKSKISVQYPLVELVTGALFASVATAINPLESFASFVLTLDLLVIFSLLIVISVYDIKHTIIPNFFVYSFIGLSLIYKFVIYKVALLSPIFIVYDMLFGFALFIAFFLLWFLSGGRAMGFGDAKLVLGIGIFLGYQKGIIALLLAFWIGAVVGIILLFLKHKSFTMKSEIPFGPFLVLGTIISFFFQITIF